MTTLLVKKFSCGSPVFMNASIAAVRVLVLYVIDREAVSNFACL